MAKLSKTQEWLIVVSVGVVLLAVVGGSYWYLTQEKSTNTTQETATVIETEEEKELNQLEEDLESLESLDTSELDSIQEDLDSIDLSELE